MKNFVKTIISIMMMSACTLSVSAQNVVKDSISTNDFGACKTYLEAHPQDTIRNTSKNPKLELLAINDTTVTRNEGLTVINMKAGDRLYLAGTDVWKENGQVVRGNCVRTGKERN